MPVAREQIEEAQNTFGACNWTQNQPVPTFFELRAMEAEIVTGEQVTFISGFWYHSHNQTHAARVRVGEENQIWVLGACSGRWYR